MRGHVEHAGVCALWAQAWLVLLIRHLQADLGRKKSKCLLRSKVQWLDEAHLSGGPVLNEATVISEAVDSVEI